MTSVDWRRNGPICGLDPRCYRQCRCSRWPDYKNRFGDYVVPHDESQEYYEKVLATGPIAYWPLWETAGVVAECLTNAAMNGIYNSDVSTWPPGAGIGDGNTAPFFDGANDFVYLGAGALAALNAVFSALNGSVMTWLRVSAVGVWTDAAIRYALNFMDTTDGNEQIAIYKSNVNNRLVYDFRSGGVTSQFVRNGIAETGWFQTIVTWDSGANEVKAYYNGVQQDVTRVYPGVWAGAINRGVIGAPNTVPTLAWHGWEQHTAFWDRTLTPGEAATLAVV